MGSRSSWRRFGPDGKCCGKLGLHIAEDIALHVKVEVLGQFTATVQQAYDHVELGQILRMLCPICRSFTPSVIEPSFGVGRILYCLFEHAFYARDGKKPFTAVKPPVG